MPNIERIQFSYKGYKMIAEYFYDDSNVFRIVGLEFANPTNALLFIAESTGGEIDDIETAAEKAVEEMEYDKHEYQKAKQKLEGWYPEREYAKP